MTHLQALHDAVKDGQSLHRASYPQDEIGWKRANDMLGAARLKLQSISLERFPPTIGNDMCCERLAAMIAKETT